MVEISTLGSCVTRDIIRIANHDDLFKMKGNVGHISPMTMFSEPLDNCEDVIEIIQNYSTGFNKRNAIMDINSNSFEFLLANRSEWVLVDLMDIRFDFLEKGGQRVSFFENHQQITDGLLALKERGFTLRNAKDISTEELYAAIDTLAEKLLEHWSPEKIIVVNDIPQDLLLYEDRNNDNGYLKETRTSWPVYMQHLNILNKYLKDKLGCNMINLPPMQIAPCSLTHTFGVYPCHYTDDVYRYLFHQICAIVFPEKADYYEVQRLRTLETIKKTYYRSLRSDVKNTLSNDIIKLCSTDKMIDYFRQLRSLENCVVCVAVKGTVGSYFGTVLQKLFFTLGLGEDLARQLWSGYVGIVKGGITLFDEKGGKNECVEYIDDIDFAHFHVSSKPTAVGNSAQVIINGTDYALDLRGLNVVVYDNATQRVVDSVAFDTAKKELTMTRKPDLLSSEELIRVELKKMQGK